MSAAVADLDTPAVVAARVARVQEQIDRWAMVSILLGLAFTMVNVQQFAAAGAQPWTLGWLAAWSLDPMVSILLLVVVRTEQVTARWQVTMAWQVTAAKWAAFTATYVMNTWASWQALTWPAIVLHSVPPVFVLIGAEVLPKLREGLTEAVLKARDYAAHNGRAPLEPPPTAAAIPEPTADRTPRPPEPAPSMVMTPTGAGPARAGAQDTGDVDPAGRSGGESASGPLPVHPDAGDTPHAGPPPTLPKLVEDPVDVDVDDAGPSGKSRIPTPPVEEVPPTTDTGAGSGPGASSTPPDRVAPSPTASSDRTGDDLDARVIRLVELLRANPELSGPEAVNALEAADLGPVSARTARRLLGKARDAFTGQPRPASNATDDRQSRATFTDDDSAPRQRAETGTDHGRPAPLSLVRPTSTSASGEH